MGTENDFDVDLPVREVIKRLLIATLPAELADAAPELVDRVTRHPEVAPHIHGHWGDLSEGEGNIVAREVGVVARDVIRGAVDLPGRHLH